jgi:hypothetical protein
LGTGGWPVQADLGLWLAQADLGLWPAQADLGLYGTLPFDYAQGRLFRRMTGDVNC